MKVHFVTSTEYYKKSPQEFNKIREIIEKFSGEKPTTYSDMDGPEISYDTDPDQLTRAVKQDEKALKEADALVANITTSSAGPGFDVATALSLKKPVLVLKREDDEAKRSPHLMTVKKSKMLHFVRYNDSNLEKVMRDFVNASKQMLDTKFILIISPEIDRYLEWAADFRRMHKAQIVRNAVEDMIGKDTEYKKVGKEE